MLDTLRLILSILDEEERRRFWALCRICLPLGVAEVAGVLGALPFILVAAKPDAAREHWLIAPLAEAFGPQPTSTLLLILGLVSLGVMLASVGIRTAALHMMTRFARDVGVSLQTRVLALHLATPMTEARRRHGADLQTTVLSEIEEVVEAVVLNALKLAAHASLTACLILVLIVSDPVAGVTMVLVVGAAYLAVFGMMRRALTRLGRERVEVARRRHRILQDAMGGLRELQLAQREAAALSRFHAAAARLATLRARAALIRETPRNVLEVLIFGGMIVLTLWFVTTRQGGLTAAVPLLALYALAGARLFPALQRLYRDFAKLQATAPALEALAGELIARGVAEAGAPLPAPLLAREIRLDDVTFTYPGAARPALRGASLAIPAGAVVGIVGETGAGKSTAVDMLLGLISPDSGRVVVDGAAVTPANRRAWRGAVGYVPQDIFLTDASIAENIAFGDDPAEIDAAAVERAAAVAGLTPLIRSLPRGLGAVVGERGVLLSGGERQRIAIARALYRDPKLIVFDEATSALDTVTERTVMRAVRAIAPGKTIVLVAHRLNTVRACDVIFVFEAGRVVDAGGYEALAARNDLFRALHEARPQ